MEDSIFLKKEDVELEKPVTVGVLMDTLVEFADQVLLPRFEKTVDQKIGIANAQQTQEMKTANAQQTHELKSYIDDKLAVHTAELFSRLDRKYQSEKQFREKVVELFRKHQIGTTEDIAYLAGLAAGI
ncbi:MAG: hypothetical protein WC618_05930 [Patescibacteria group bacterium]